jgi:hypothetical protein
MPGVIKSAGAGCDNTGSVLCGNMLDIDNETLSADLAADAILASRRS